MHRAEGTVTLRRDILLAVDAKHAPSGRTDATGHVRQQYVLEEPS